MVWATPTNTFHIRFAYSQESMVWEMHYSTVQMVWLNEVDKLQDLQVDITTLTTWDSKT